MSFRFRGLLFVLVLIVAFRFWFCFLDLIAGVVFGWFGFACCFVVGNLLVMLCLSEGGLLLLRFWF